MKTGIRQKILVAEDTQTHRQLIHDIFKETEYESYFVEPPEERLMDEVLEIAWVTRMYEKIQPDLMIVDLAWNGQEVKSITELVKQKDRVSYWRELEKHNKVPQVFELLDKLEQEQKNKILPVIILTRYLDEISSILEQIFPHRTERIIIQKPSADKAKWAAAILPTVEKCLQSKKFLENAAVKFIGDIDTSMTINLYSNVLQIASNVIDAPILITGETGIGKSFLSHAIHNVSKRSNGPFIDRNIASIPKELLYSELFGHKKGAFTGASEDKPGIFEAAEGGTVFLDEIGDLPMSEQIHLLTALDENYVYRLGDNKKREIDVRVIFATNKDLSRMVAQGSFRKDLYYRIRVIPIKVPPLRERKADILLLSNHFLTEYASKSNKPKRSLTNKEILSLKNFPFPGNVRQLRSLMMRAVLLDISIDESIAMEENIIDEELAVESVDKAFEVLWQELIITKGGLKTILKQVDDRLCSRAILETNSNVEAATMLQVGLSTLESKKRKLQNS